MHASMDATAEAARSMLDELPGSSTSTSPRGARCGCSNTGRGPGDELVWSSATADVPRRLHVVALVIDATTVCSSEVEQFALRATADEIRGWRDAVDPRNTSGDAGPSRSNQVTASEQDSVNA